jgi:ABC-type tungstate transport system substrate-binding protein
MIKKDDMTELMRKITKQDIRNTLAMVWTVCSFIFLYKLLVKRIPTENKDVVIAIAGLIIGQLVVIMGYYFGQSKSEVDDKKSENE